MQYSLIVVLNNQGRPLLKKLESDAWYIVAGENSSLFIPVRSSQLQRKNYDANRGFPEKKNLMVV